MELLRSLRSCFWAVQGEVVSDEIATGNGLVPQTAPKLLSSLLSRRIPLIQPERLSYGATPWPYEFSAPLRKHSGDGCVSEETTSPRAALKRFWLRPKACIGVGDRTLTAVRPPLFDNPTPIGIYDNKSEAFLSADCFGAIIPSPAQNADDVTEGDLAQGMTSWASADSPWVHMVEPSEFSQALDRIRQIAPKMIFSAHLPPARGKTEQFLELLATVPTSTPFVAPNQTALEQILAQMRGGS